MFVQIFKEASTIKYKFRVKRQETDQKLISRNNKPCLETGN